MTFDNCLRDGSQHGSREYIVGANWGSSRLRIYLIDRALNVVDEDGSSGGILFGRGGSRSVRSPPVSRLFAQVGECPRFVISGMAGSVSGLTEAGYGEVPISMTSLTEASVSIGEISGAPAWVMAGGLGRRDEITGITDVMVVPSARARETRSNVLAQVEREEETRKKVRDGWTVDQILAEFGRI